VSGDSRMSASLESTRLLERPLSCVDQGESHALIIDFATEMACALVEFVRCPTSDTVILSAVDEPNVSSVRVFEEIGFQSTGSSPGAFGKMLYFRLALL